MQGEIIFDNPPVRARMCKYGAMIYYTTDQFIGRSLDLYGEYSEGEVNFFRQIAHQGATIIDAGANIGVFTAFFAQAVGAAGRVFSFEPQRQLYYLLCGNLALNRLTNVTAAHSALGSGKGTILLPIVDYAKGGNFGGFALGNYANIEGATDKVGVSTIDDLGLKECRLIKIDVEGMERDVLEGTTETIARCKPLLYVENDRAQKSAQLISWLLERDYRLFWHLTRLFNPGNHFGQPKNVFGGVTSFNMVGVPRSLGIRIHELYEIVSPEDTARAAERLSFGADEELAGYDKALAARADDLTALSNRGLVLLKRWNRFDEAVATFDKALAIDPGHVEAQCNRAEALHLLKRHDEALASFERALAVQPDHGPSLAGRETVIRELERAPSAASAGE